MRSQPRERRVRSGVLRRVACLALALAVLLAAPFSPASAAVVRTQTITLRAGWNAVFLEVDPLDPTPTAAFRGLAIETVAAFRAETKPEFYPRNPTEHPWQDEGWDIWYAPTRPEAFLSTLSLVRGQRAYLIQATTDQTWAITGNVVARPIEWTADSFTLTGFSVDPEAPPTFQRFFAGATAHRGQRVLRLTSGRWTLVRDPAQATLRSGEAYWVFSKGASDFQGPIRVQAGGGQRLGFGDAENGLRLEVANADASAAQVMIETLPAGDPLPLSYEFRDLKSLATAYVSMPDALALPSLRPAARTSLNLFVKREQMTRPAQSGLLKISNLKGALVWVPVEVSRPE